MSKVETKADLLRFMKKHGACREATQWVKFRKEKTFLEIWNACHDYSWLYWLMYEQDEELAAKWYVYAIYSCEEEDILAILKRAYKG